jgi:hypothetical protein
VGSSFGSGCSRDGDDSPYHGLENEWQMLRYAILVGMGEPRVDDE